MLGRVPAVDTPPGQIHHREGAVNKFKPIIQGFAVPMDIADSAAMIRFCPSEHDNFVIFREKKG